MKIRTWAVAGVAVIVALAGAALLVLERTPDDDDVPIHGGFRRFQGTDANSSRIAGLGGRHKLSRVELPKR